MLGTPSATKYIIDKYGFSFQKKFGQNFLVDSNILDSIIMSANVKKDDCVLEIGPGIGTMTQLLCENAGKVIAVEIDDKLIPILGETLSAYDNVEVIHNDILKVDIKSLSEKENGGRPMKVVANLPYYITTPVIMELLESRVPLESITIMVQKEVADRMKCGPGSKDYGALSLAVQYFTEPHVVTVVPPSCFIPPPKVESTIIRLDIHKERPVTVKDEKLLFRIIRASFNQRRKTLVNGLSNGMGWALTKEQVAAAIVECGFPETIRGEALSLEEFGKLSDKFAELL